jgi:branched-chain amino acid transport system ATP-binding protein
MALKLADRGYVLETGSITMSDTADALLNDKRVQSANSQDSAAAAVVR